MKRERPILMSSPMVRAILAGTKTVTRRIVKPQPELDADSRWPGWKWPSHQARTMLELREMPSACPYGTKGDRLWVRETFGPYAGSGSPCSIGDATYAVLGDGTQVYRDGQRFPPAPKYAPGAFDSVRWRPSIHMPRWASRIDLEVVSVRVERLHDITEEDARAEGVEPHITTRKTSPSKQAADVEHRSYREGFANLWRAINGAASWDANPWVWAISFRRVE